MKLLVLSTWWPYPPSNGSKIRAHYLIRALASAHDVTVVAFDPGGDGTVTADGGFRRIETHRITVDPYRYTRLPQGLKFLSPIPVSLWPVPDMRAAVRNLQGSIPYDAVVAVQTPVARYALSQGGSALILDVDTALTYQMRERHLSQTGLVSRARTWVSWQKAVRFESSLMRHFAVCTVVSDLEVRYLRKEAGLEKTRFVVIPNGVDCKANRDELISTTPATLVYNGAMTYSANYDAMRYFLADIYPLVKRQVPDASMTITGSTAGVDLRGLNLDESVHLSGYVDDIRPVVAGSSVCVVPLREGGGTRLKILEAMALGTPVVSTFKGAEGLDVVTGKHLLIADDPAQFAAETVRLLHDDGLRRYLAANARRLVETCYDWTAIGKRFAELVEEVVARRRSNDNI